MRAIRVAPVALLGAAAFLSMAPAASADSLTGGTSTPFTPTITPSTVAPGGSVTLGAMGCAGDATAFSGVFDTTTIPRGRSATAMVDREARRGAVYEVTFRCGTTTRSANLTISGSTTPTTTPTTSSTASPAGVLGGLGGSVDTMDPAEIAAGSALVATAAAGAVYVLRRRRTGSQH
ncbi:hypothetical protein ACFYY2_01595 [Streptomyces sp. NPDC001822]|uniref:hypothetical protein n=1 Tax=Streptomyces sp. NPDC001822 TaxID=3364614 RepID=UPI00367923DB